MGKNLIFKTMRRTLVLGERTLIMGILNVTPDSFSDGGRFQTPHEAVEAGLRMADEGADIIDIGGESTRPGSEPVPDEEELKRVLPVIEKLAKLVSVPISVDTTKAAVARKAIDAGAEIINDISALRFDKEMGAVAAKAGAGLILMHMRGVPKTMQEGPIVYQDLLAEIKDFLRERIFYALSLGVEMERIMIDPGIGFGKTAEDNMRILKNLQQLQELERPILTGVSRKSFIGKVLDVPPQERLEGTIASVVVSIMNGSSVVRVHDVGVIKKVVTMTDAILRV